jgi:hypothetical protein
MTEQVASSEQELRKSALQENIERKGKNAYYFAHSHKANGPSWDGKAEPRLLSKQSSTGSQPATATSSFHYHKSNITKYAFLDDGMKVKLFIDMEGIGEKCTTDDVSLEFTQHSLSLVVRNFKTEDQCLSFGKLSGEITSASFRLKPNRIILTLEKAAEGEWHTINDKGAPDHDIV